MNNIIWLTSYPKSGNTWLRVLLSNLLSDSNEPININDLGTIPISSSRILFDNLLGTNSSDLTFDEINRFRPQVYRKISEGHDKDFFLKTHDAWTLNSDGIPIFPKDVTKCVIYIIRNPLDIAVSYSYHTNESLDKTIFKMNEDGFGLCLLKNRLSYQLPQILTTWSNHVISWIHHSELPTFVIRYEDLLIDTYSSIADVLNFINMKFVEQNLITAVNHSSFEELQFQESEYGFKEKGTKSKSFFRSGKQDSWKSILNSNQVAQIIEKHSMIMQEFGYL